MTTEKDVLYSKMLFATYQIEQKNGIGEPPLSSKWDEYNARFKQLEQHFNENHTK